MLGKLPDDPEIENIDPFMRAWMFHSWIEDYHDEHKTLENQGYLIGSFINPEMVRKILGKDSETHSSSDQEFEELTAKLREQTIAEIAAKNSTKKRKRRSKLKV